MLQILKGLDKQRLKKTKQKTQQPISYFLPSFFLLSINVTKHSKNTNPTSYFHSSSFLSKNPKTKTKTKNLYILENIKK
jgi:hypothetical protein